MYLLQRIQSHSLQFINYIFRSVVKACVDTQHSTYCTDSIHTLNAKPFLYASTILASISQERIETTLIRAKMFFCIFTIFYTDNNYHLHLRILKPYITPEIKNLMVFQKGYMFENDLYHRFLLFIHSSIEINTSMQYNTKLKFFESTTFS